MILGEWREERKNFSSILAKFGDRHRITRAMVCLHEAKQASPNQGGSKV
jgi:hypothetical protein